MKRVVSYSKLSSASCDLSDLIEFVKSERGIRCLEDVKDFVEGLYPPDYPEEENEGCGEIKYNKSRLQNCINQLQSFSESFGDNDKEIIEDSEIAVADLTNEVLNFLLSLKG